MKAAIVVAVFCLAVAVTVEGYGVYEDLAGLDRTEDTRTEKRGNYNKTPEAAAAAKVTSISVNYITYPLHLFI